MKRYILLVILLALTPLLHAAERPTVAILPFGIAKDRKSLRWLSLATASTLIENLRRMPSVRVLPFANVVQELRSAGIDPDQAAWTPAVATEPLGRWLKADLVVLGAVGKLGDQRIANIILQGSEPPEPAKGTQIWMAARVVDINSGETIGNGYVEGRKDNIFDLQGDLLMQLGHAMNTDGQPGTGHPMVTMDFKTYQKLAKIEQTILDLPTITREKKREQVIKRGLKRAEGFIRRNPDWAWAHTYQGIFYGLQNRPKSAMKAFETAIEKDPQFTTPRYGLADLAIGQNDLPQAVAMLETITQIAPWDDEAYHLQGTVYRLLNQPEQALSAYQNALAAYQKRPQTLYETGQLYLLAGQYRKAIMALQMAVEQMPGELPYQIALADAHLFVGEISRARVVLDRLADVSALDPEYQFVRGKFDHLTDQYDGALAHFNTALESLPNRADLHAAMAQTYMAQNRFDDALKAFTLAKSNGIALPKIALPFGDTLEAQNQLSGAEDLYRQSLEQTPNRADLRFRLIKHLLNREATKQAIEALQVGVRLHPDRGDFHLLLGDLYDSQNENLLALRHYEKSLDLGVSATEVATQLGRIYLAQNQPDKARAYYEIAHLAGAVGADVYAGLGFAEERLGNQRAALKAFQQALKANPLHPEAQSAAARLTNALRPKPKGPTTQQVASRAARARANGDLGAAQSGYEKALASDSSRSDWWNDLATVYIQLGQQKRAETAFQNAIQNAPSSPEYQYNLGKLYADMGWLYDAETACHEALNIDPNYLPAQQQLGSIYLEQGAYLHAKSSFEVVLRAETQNPFARLGLGNALAALGDWDAAKTAYVAEEVGAAATIGLGNILLA
jgi:tetratricopeptide (TPR) repeat protein